MVFTLLWIQNVIMRNNRSYLRRMVLRTLLQGPHPPRKAEKTKRFEDQKDGFETLRFVVSGNVQSKKF
jgi:hypothetical protein